ncbi:adenylyltransferase/cytidyltransferase family protein [Zhongshania aquimaris]|uniref:Adenylyltransferase/cytidyltransferase family protein n=1 Tax=Zhongshania aquimaris TaxID=2857107 RepID=A0ABS6VPN7_9GAMM|nr:adenylyltransferase/cytidyltransferase family protein [Zhongshania aquimaris]MBW2939730.1 adenylyltransferase/cytidyltransferase family protein [Zhongshania aquimaris]
MRRVITFGTFDVFHVGHLRLLQRAKALGDELIVGVSTDRLNFEKKNRYPVFTQLERSEIISALKCVSSVFLEFSLEDKEKYILEHGADVLVMGDDWRGRFDQYGNVCDVVYLERTPSISTTATIEKISFMK